MSTFKKLIRKPFWFTLVELIVVITILVILWTIAFTSLSGYSGSARDSSRISDMANISKGLDIAYAKTSSYPMPDGYFTVTYSGWAVWYQWEVGTTVMNILTSAWAKLSKQPLDPLVTTAKYTYSKVAYAKDSYQLKANWEGDKIAYNHNPWNLTLSTSSPTLLLAGEGSKDIPPLLLGEDRGEVKELPFISQAQAASWNPTVAYIVGNYNWVVAKTQTGTMTYILAVPSIMSNTGSTWSVWVILAIDSAQKTLSGALLTNGWSNTTGVTYNPVVAYAASSLPSNILEKTALATGIATAYSGSSLVTSSNIQPYIAAYSTNDTNTLASLGENAGSSVGGSMVNTQIPQYPGCSAPDFFVGWRYWAACNVGATTVSTWCIAGSSDSTIWTETTNGKYFQWGENVAWDYDGGTGSADNCTWNRDTQSCGSSALSDWPATVSDTMSGGVNRWHDWSTTDNRGPCALGYHVPTHSEWIAAVFTVGLDFNFIIKLPATGNRYKWSGQIWNQGLIWNYWSSSTDDLLGWRTVDLYWGAYSFGGMYRNFGLSVRCIKN